MTLQTGAFALFLCFAAVNASAAELRAAVASNFKPAMEPLLSAFEIQTGHRVSVSFASTGKHYAQITNGAPFDIFLAADELSPQLLEASGRIIPGSRFTYAIGKLVLWAKKPVTGGEANRVLQDHDFRFLAIANPRTAPYGRAAEQYLTGLGIWEQLEGRLVRGENVAQVFAFVSTGNAELGLLALSQVRQVQGEITGQFWLVPDSHYEPIIQQAALISANQAASEFAAFLRGPIAREIIVSRGYSLP